MEENTIALEGLDTDRETVNLRETWINSGNSDVGEINVEALTLRAKPTTADREYGILGRKIMNLPAKRYIQFQGGLQALAGRDKGANLSLDVETRDTDGQWVEARSFPAKRILVDGEDQGSRYLVLNLSEWAGQEVRLSLALRVKPSYSNIAGREEWTPSEISAQWFMARIVSSPFRVIVGEPEKISLSDSTPARGNSLQSISPANPLPDSLIKASTIVSTTSSKEAVLFGGATQEGYVMNPSDTEIATTILPEEGDYPSRAICYFTSSVAATYQPHGASHGVHSPESDFGASSRLIDFASNTSKNMYNATVSEIRNAMIKYATGASWAVLQPSGIASRDFDDHYVGITSIVTDTLGAPTYKPVIHAFFYAEDHFKNDQGTSNDHNYVIINEKEKSSTYGRIAYARSIVDTHDYGRQFSKIYHDNSVYPIITDAAAADESVISVSMSQGSNGVGGASVYPIGDYYYMIYHTQVITRNAAGEFLVHPVTGLYQKVPILCAARALKSAVNNPYYATQPNPWLKFKEVASPPTDDDNFDELGVGGEYSGLWNVEVDENNHRTAKRINANNWRTYPKVSYNEYINSVYPDHQGILICNGGFSKDFAGIWIHTSSNLLDWDGGLLVCFKDDELEQGGDEDWVYPTLVGSTGYDGYTTQTNKLYMFHNRGGGNGDLYRFTLTFSD